MGLLIPYSINGLNSFISNFGSNEVTAKLNKIILITRIMILDLVNTSIPWLEIYIIIKPNIIAINKRGVSNKNSDSIKVSRW